ncbi:histidine kinase [uncultured Tenacibaculum sp.]|uniref:sensor histidine kinase n=1 Tax=uncultured Tenacibaculum sp. TaxID=174713 RepID=UPI002638B2F6|nr:histidine kinase [uncultured Tenacibaculum sp.]
MKVVEFYKENKNFILFLFIFSWLFTLKNNIGSANSWQDFVFHLDAPIWVFIGAFLIFLLTDFVKRKVNKNETNEVSSVKRYINFFLISYVFYILSANIFGILISLIFNTFSRNFNSSFMITYRLFYQTIDFVIFGGISLAYLYSKDNSKYRKRLNEYEITNSKSKIQQLKAQLNPHFLFNNLNILDQLIEEDQDKASDFLSSFSELYRYALNSAESELIEIEKELTFTQNYFELMEKKYEGYYQLNITNEIKNSRIIVPPFCLQVLIENAIMHNLGTKQNPVIITVTLENGVKVSNNKVELNRKKKSNGVALKNLNKQFELLTKKPIEIQDAESVFTVILPLIKTNSYD